MVSQVVSGLFTVGSFLLVRRARGGSLWDRTVSARQPQRKVDIMMSKVAFLFTSLFLLVTVCSGLIAAELYVAPPPLGNNKNPGTEAEPFGTIQGGINAATDGDTITVAKGTYVENINFKGKNIVLRSTDPTDWNVVKETIIDGNQAGSVVIFGGTENETCVLCGFTIRNGRARDGGGILGGTEDNITGAAIRNNLITKNISTGSGSDMRGGGGVAYCGGLIENNTIAENSAYQGGGVHVCAGTIRNNIIAGNSASTWAGGLAGCSGIIENNLIIGNTAQADGGMGWCDGIIRNCTIWGNSAVDHGGGIAHWAPTIQNCVIWGNTAGINPQLHETGVPTYSCIQGWAGGGEGNIDRDPRLVDAENGDFRLLPSSPCIDVGTNEDWMNGAIDLDGNLRILVGALSLTVDMGAYEHRFPLAIGRNTPTEVELSWAMRPQRSYTILSSFNMTAEPWTEETTMLGGKSGGPAVWVDPSATSALKFYKIAIE